MFKYEPYQNLSEFLRAPEHFVAREKILHMKASLDMKISAATCGIQLQMTEPEIDNQGYDFSIAWGYDLLYIQNKSTISDARVSKWEIHPLHLQIPFSDRDLSPQIDGKSIGGLEGAMGGVLLHQISHEGAAQGRLDVTYFYFDIFYATAVASGLSAFNDFQPDEAKAILHEIEKGKRGQRIALPLKAMLPIKSPSAILAFRFGLPDYTNYVSHSTIANKLNTENKPLEWLDALWCSQVGQWVRQVV